MARVCREFIDTFSPLIYNVYINMATRRFLGIFAAVVMMTFLFVVESRGATRRALVFGLGKQKDPAWAKINGDVDVRFVCRSLVALGYTDIHALKNEKATKRNMVAAFKSLVARCDKGDIVYVHYSGHGQYITDLNGDESLRWHSVHGKWDESWVPYDAYMVPCEEDLGSKHFVDDEVARYLSMVRDKIGSTGELVVVVDACHSGDATRGDDDEFVRGVDVKFNIPRTPGIIQEEPIEERWLTISACRPYQLSTEMKVILGSQTDGQQEVSVGKLTYALYLLGKEAHNMSNDRLEKHLNEFMEKNKRRLPQNPMVSGQR